MKLLYALLWCLAWLPFRALYVLSDGLFLLVYYVARYRRRLVDKQLLDSFPEKDARERQAIARRFYHFFCDYIVETIKLIHLTPEEIMARMDLSELRVAEEGMREHGKKFGFFYIGHYGNWEWLASFPLWLPANYDFAQIYHPLRSKGMDRLFLRIREQYHGRCIPMKDTLRQILTAKRDGKSMIVGFIADQSPKWEAMHHWTTFLNHKTSFFIGTEKIGKKVDAALFYIEMARPSRGYYRLHAVPLTYDVRNTPDFECTDRYAALLEQAIRREPHLWLWTHNRWKRTYEEWVERQSDKARSTVGAIS